MNVYRKLSIWALWMIVVLVIVFIVWKQGTGQETERQTVESQIVDDREQAAPDHLNLREGEPASLEQERAGDSVAERGASLDQEESQLEIDGQRVDRASEQVDDRGDHAQQVDGAITGPNGVAIDSSRDGGGEIGTGPEPEAMQPAPDQISTELDAANAEHAAAIVAIRDQYEYKLLELETSCRLRAESLIDQIAEQLSVEGDLDLARLQSEYLPVVTEAETACDDQYTEIVAEAVTAYSEQGLDGTAVLNEWDARYEAAKEKLQFSAMLRLMNRLQEIASLAEES